MTKPRQSKDPSPARLALAALLLAAPLPAATIDWLPTADTPAPFSDPANWSTGTTPTPADAARFDTSTTHTATLTADTTTDQLLLAHDDLTLDLASHAYTLANTNLSLQQTAASSLTLTGGSLKSYSTLLSPNATDSSSLTLAGPATTWTNAGSFNVAYRGTSTLALRDSASLSSYFLTLAGTPGSTGTLTLDGPATSLSTSTLDLGSRGAGAITLRNGASLSSTSTLSLATTPGSAGTLTLQDPASSLTANQLYLGGSPTAPGGPATLNLPAGSLSANSLKLWNSPNSSLNLTGGLLKVGYFSPASDPSRLHWTAGTLQLTNAGFVVSNGTVAKAAVNNPTDFGPSFSLTAGMSLNLTGPSNYHNFLVVDHGGSLSATHAPISTTDTIFVGYESTGSLALDDHASMTSPNGVIGFYSSNSGPPQLGNGAVTLDHASTWTLSGTATPGFTVPAALIVGGSGPGSLSIRGGSAVSDLSALVAYGSDSSVSVDGPGSSWSTAGKLLIGSIARGSVTVTRGSTLSAQSLYLAATTRTTGSLSLSSGATLTVADALRLGGSLTTPGGSASLSLADSSATVASSLLLYNTPSTSLSLTRSTLTIGTPAAPGSLDNAAAISLADHSTLTLHGPLANAGTLTLSPTTELLWDPTPSTPDPAAVLRAQLATAHLRPADPATTIGYIPLTPTTLRIAPTLPGDADLDGRLTPDDYALLDRGFAAHASTWSQGDFNYDGIINNQDYLLIDAAYLTQSPNPTFLSMRESQFGPTYVSTLLASLPEPSPLLACGLAAPLFRRRKTPESHRFPMTFEGILPPF